MIQNMRLSLAIFFATSNIAGLGIGFSKENVSIIILSSVLILFFIAADRFILRALYGYYYRAMRILKIENKYHEETIFDVFRFFIARGKVKIDIIKEISNI